jgi:hypothetical protein
MFWFSAEKHPSIFFEFFNRIGHFLTLAFKLYVAFRSRTEYLLVNQTFFEVQRTREYTAKTFLLRLSLEQES